MYFAGEYSKFEEGQQVYFYVPDKALFEPCTILSIGILGSKLGQHLFLYEIRTTDGKTHKVTQDVLSIDCMGNREPKTLHLVLKHEWYDKINSGEKKEEYRTISPNWAKRFLWFEYLEGEDLALLCHYLTGPFSEFPIDLNYINTGMSGRRVDSNGIPINDINSYFRFGLQIAKYQYVVFHRGYTKETMKFDLDSISIGKGNPKLGAPEGKNVFILKLGKRHELV